VNPAITRRRLLGRPRQTGLKRARGPRNAEGDTMGPDGIAYFDRADELTRELSGCVITHESRLL
jgi:hypothetical protein